MLIAPKSVVWIWVLQVYLFLCDITSFDCSQHNATCNCKEKALLALITLLMI